MNRARVWGLGIGSPFIIAHQERMFGGIENGMRERERLSWFFQGGGKRCVCCGIGLSGD